MNVRRGDVVLVLYPFASGMGGSRRPALVVQNDADNARLQNTITTSLHQVAALTHLLIERATPEGQQAGLLHDSLVSCNNLAPIYEDRINRIVSVQVGPMPMLLPADMPSCLLEAKKAQPHPVERPRTQP